MEAVPRGHSRLAGSSRSPTVAATLLRPLWISRPNSAMASFDKAIDRVDTIQRLAPPE
jgi:hypothetical protein